MCSAFLISAQHKRKKRKGKRSVESSESCSSAHIDMLSAVTAFLMSKLAISQSTLMQLSPYCDVEGWKSRPDRLTQKKQTKKNNILYKIIILFRQIKGKYRWLCYGVWGINFCGIIRFSCPLQISTVVFLTFITFITWRNISVLIGVVTPPNSISGQRSLIGYIYIISCG